MFCTNCGKEISDDAKNCKWCGATAKNNLDREINQDPKPDAQGQSSTMSDYSASTPNADTSAGMTLNKSLPKKKVAIIVVVIIAILAIIVSCARVNSGKTVIKSRSSPTGSSFNCEVKEYVKNYNNFIDDNISYLKEDGMSKKTIRKLKKSLKLEKSSFVKTDKNTYVWHGNNGINTVTLLTDKHKNIYKILIDLSTSSATDNAAFMVGGFAMSTQPDKDIDDYFQIAEKVYDDGSSYNGNVIYELSYDFISTDLSITASLSE